MIEPKCFFLRKTFKVKKIYFCHNLETRSPCDACYSLNYTILKMLALHLTMCLWNHLVCFGSTLLVCSESESWQRNGSQSPSPNDLEFATPNLCVCGRGELWGGAVCLPTYCLWSSPGNRVRKMFTFNILGRKWEGTRWWMTRYLYWLTKSACWDCSCSNPWGAGRDPEPASRGRTKRFKGRAESTPSGVLLHFCHQLFEALASHQPVWGW